MKLLMRKLIVSLITVATLGIYSPTALLEVDAEEPKDSIPNSDIDQGSPQIEFQQDEPEEIPDTELINPKDHFIYEIKKQAKEQTIMKFGPRITNQVEDEFTNCILPTMEAVITSVIEDAGDDYVQYEITEEPAGGYGERIFHVFDHKEGQDVVRFHVRRDNRPLDGYYFNFHYHLRKDGFKEHHEIGEIYWAKNTPPKWMA